jgi:HlyD family secretion protein
VWVLDGELLRAIEVVVGISDNRFTEIISGDVKEGQKLVTGVKTPTS